MLTLGRKKQSRQYIQLANITHINARRGWYGRVGLFKFIRGTPFRSDWLFVDEALKCWASRDIIPSSDGMNLFDLMKLVNIFWRDARWICQHNILLAILLKNKQINSFEVTKYINPIIAFLEAYIKINRVCSIRPLINNKEVIIMKEIRVLIDYSD